MSPGAQARWRVNAIFFLHGVIVANWVARIPAVQQKLSLPVGALGAYLLCAAAGALCGMPLTARWVNRFESAGVTRVSSMLFCAVLPLPALVPRPWMLAPALFVFGFSAGTMEVSMNTQAVVVERRLARPVMTTFHALYSLGGMTGAGMGGLAAWFGFRPAAHLAAAAPVLLLASFFATQNLLSDDRQAHVPMRVSWNTHVRALWVLGVLAFCVLIGEGAMSDWTAVYLSGIHGVTAAVAAAGYAVFSVCMAAGRFCGDWLRSRMAEVTIVRGGAALSCAGLASGLLAGGLVGALVGFACTGFGFSVIFPILTMKSGQVPGVRPQAGIAAVTAMGYTGFLVGPPLIGFAAQLTSLRVGLGIIPLLSGIAVILSGLIH